MQTEDGVWRRKRLRAAPEPGLAVEETKGSAPT